MIEYALRCIVVLAAVYLFDHLLKTRVGRRRTFLYALAMALLTQLVVDNLTAWRGFWNFNRDAVLGVRVPVIPLENLLFGIALFYSTIISWEFSSRNLANVFK
ncbi:MAG: lycopene cyclase domain-containing protein [Candidatus Fermentimicrarchaeum limneticum]|uniref:Lycopene cyclase domain-containing protein n=1 Tax=Fermentimicrarchaeum limneticum TaxID=2795018 RepID=A0A7D5XLH7_FERL1|nr:MAG: lycopene cyclase domain-containing protein [Candidatus Fermentimicrarchaeum limneticum]